jgi:hypothetical protein
VFEARTACVAIELGRNACGVVEDRRHPGGVQRLDGLPFELQWEMAKARRLLFSWT